MPQEFLRVVFSPGVAPDKWFTRFDERVAGWSVAAAQAENPLLYLDATTADLAIVRLSVEAEEARGGVAINDKYHHVRLYDEQVGIAAPKDHPIAVEKQVRAAELGEEKIMYATPTDGEVVVGDVREALQVVAANVGVAVAPRPLLRGINQRGVVHRDLVGLGELEQKLGRPVGGTRVALMWLKERDDEVIQDFVGICKGRGEGSSRQVTRKAGVKRRGAGSGGRKPRRTRRDKRLG
ncbi:MAG TPA: hypothetical protein H9867_00830 [Candidatus Corynebacterium gallistercoris]|uniref:LysR substrate-binding domain-containing protein n=1 Tax=Candidatus Corynebacterium gallistercoris TaxID=2838530 RepID=A0A9D1UPN5_9CORY|nr:hypothetical protein [Candidatus Corynebacterium gallistercoris]